MNKLPVWSTLGRSVWSVVAFARRHPMLFVALSALQLAVDESAAMTGSRADLPPASFGWGTSSTSRR